MIQDVIEIIFGEKLMHHCNCNNAPICIERGKIRWDKDKGNYIHIRYDGCVCSSSLINKSDCLITFYRDGDNKLKIYAIEVKDENPNANEVKDQIQTCLNHLEKLLMKQQNYITIIPVLYAEKYKGFINKQLLTIKLRCFGKPYSIRKLKHNEELIRKTLKI